MPPESTAPAPADGLSRERIHMLAKDLGRSLQAVMEVLPEEIRRPQALATAIGTNKVFTSRLLKALREPDPVAVAFHLPGPEPLRRFLAEVEGQGVPARLRERATEALRRWENLIRTEAGDRAAMLAVLAEWLPEKRDAYAVNRRQAAFRALSEVHGAAAEVSLGTALLHPSEDGEHLDVVWLMGLLGLRRLRPGARVKLNTRRLTGAERARHPTSLGEDDDDADGRGGRFGLDRFCQAPPAPLEAERAGDTMHYLLGGSEFGLRSAVDLLLAEVNLAEVRRYRQPGERRRSYAYAEISTPAQSLVFDVLVHRDVFPGSVPELLIYDTAGEGAADPNDRSRDVDRMDVHGAVQMLGAGDDAWSLSEVPRYGDVLRFILGRLDWQAGEFRTWRYRLEYPLYGSQVVMAFDAPERPAP